MRRALSRCVQKKLGARAVDRRVRRAARRSSRARPSCARAGRARARRAERGLLARARRPPVGRAAARRRLHAQARRAARRDRAAAHAHEELARLLDRTRPRPPVGRRALQPFAGLNPLLYNEYTQPAWRAAVAEHESRLAPIESQIAANLRRQTAGLHESPLVLLREFGRFRHLLGRPKIRQALAHEREALVSQLVEHVDGLEQSFDVSVRDGAQLELTCNLSPHVNRIVCCRQITVRAHELLNNCRALFADLKNFADLEQAASGLLSRGRREEKELLQQWSDEVEGALDDRPDSLRMRGQLMHINKEGLLTVNYSERLVRLLREVRQLSELGLHLKPEITAVAAEGEKFYRYGVMLKKVANFFNKIEKQIIPQQRPMLLDALVEFEKIVTKPTNGGSGELTWSTPTECEHYVRAAAAGGREAHAREPPARQGAPPARPEQAREPHDGRHAAPARAVEGAVAGGRPARHGHQGAVPGRRMAKWLLHWDRQMYKVVEARVHVRAREHERELQLPDSTKVELAFSQGALAFRPSIEELRSVYHREMKKFILSESRTATDKGFGNAACTARWRREHKLARARVREGGGALRQARRARGRVQAVGRARLGRRRRAHRADGLDVRAVRGQLQDAAREAQGQREDPRRGARRLLQREPRRAQDGGRRPAPAARRLAARAAAPRRARRVPRRRRVPHRVDGEALGAAALGRRDRGRAEGVEGDRRGARRRRRSRTSASKKTCCSRTRPCRRSTRRR